MMGVTGCVHKLNSRIFYSAQLGEILFSTKIQDFKKIIDNWPGNWPAKQEFGKIMGGPVAEGQ